MELLTKDDKTVRMLLLTEMKSGSFADCDRLPRETILAEELGISRTQLRDALSDLEREGFITRRHGVGTLINHHVLHVKCRMDIETEFLNIIRQNGYEPTVSFLEVSEKVADEQAARKLHILEGSPVICIRLVCSADGKPAIYSEDILEKRLVKPEYQNENFRAEEFQVIIFQFLKKFCDVEAYMDLTELHAKAADENVAGILQIPAGSPVMNMEEVDYDIDGKPIFYSNQYFAEGFFQHTVLRKKF